jgi:hypothetical protein
MAMSSSGWAVAFLATGAIGALAAGDARGETIGFDDLAPPPPNGMPLPADYRGAFWSDFFYVIDEDDLNAGWGNTLSAVSSDNLAFNAYSTTETVIEGSFLTFVGAYFRGWPEGDEASVFTASSITATGYLGATQVGQVTLELSPTEWRWLSANFSNVDRIVLSSEYFTWWLMDDITFTTTPEPGTLALLGVPLGAAWLRRRRRAGARAT